jgi:TRAP-type C4-dicarboxylate transport system substrate-binding protein
MGALTKAGEELEAVEIGLAQVGNVAAPYYAGKLPLSNWTYAVPFASGDPKVILDATKQLYRDVPELAAELEQYNQKVLIPMVIDTYNLTSIRPIVTFADFKGVKIASIGAYHPKILQAAGASAIHMPVAERYTALQTGVIEAEFLPWDISFAYKYHDYNKHATWVDMGAAMPTMLTVNLDFWKKLPKDLQDLMLAVAEEATQRNADLIHSRREAAVAGFKAAGATVHEMPFEERVKWANALTDIPGEWIKEMEDKKLAGRQVMVRYLELLEELGHKFPRQWAVDYR